MIPPLTLAESQAIDVIGETHGLEVSHLERLGSEAASTFRARVGRTGVAVKLQPSEGDDALARWRSEIMRRLTAAGRPVPALLATRTGECVGFAERDGVRMSVQVMEWVAASPYGSVPVEATLGRTLGRAAAELQTTLAGLPRPPAPITHAWDIRAADRQLAHHLGLVTDPGLREIGRIALDLHARFVAPVAAELPPALVHQDLHDANVLIDRRGEIAAILDFDDMLVGWRVAEPAIAAGYLARHLADPAEALRRTAAGWTAVVPFTDAEAAAYGPLAAIRLALNSVVWATRSASDRAAYADLRAQGSAAAFRALVDAVAQPTGEWRSDPV